MSSEYLAEKPAAPAKPKAKPHYHGHRERLRTRFREAGANAVSDYELLELLLFRAQPQGDVKPKSCSPGSAPLSRWSRRRKRVCAKSKASAKPPSPN